MLEVHFLIPFLRLLQLIVLDFCIVKTTKTPLVGSWQFLTTVLLLQWLENESEHRQTTMSPSWFDRSFSENAWAERPGCYYEQDTPFNLPSP